MFVPPAANPDRTAPRALLASPLITVGITTSELRQLIHGLEVQAGAAADIGFDAFADLLLLRIVTLREAAR